MLRLEGPGICVFPTEPVVLSTFALKIGSMPNIARLTINIDPSPRDARRERRP